MSDLTLYGGGSPFDAIRREDERGEFWSARDLMPLLDYSKWERFEDAISRATFAARNAGQDAELAFSRLREEATGGAPRSDYRVSRYGAYLIAMNGDPRKAAVAAAQTYFAVKTREAETRPQVPVQLSRREMAEYWAEAERKLESAERALAEAAPKVEAHDAYMSAEGCHSMATVAQMLGLGQNTLYARLRDEHILIAGGRRHNTPYQQYLHHFKVASRTFRDDDGKDHASFTTYVRASGVEFVRKVLKMPHPSEAM